MNNKTTLPVLTRRNEEPATMPIVPLNYVYPGLTISQIFSMIWAYRKISIIIITAILALTVIMLKVLPRTYIAKAMLMVNYQVNDPLNGKNLPINQLGSYIATQQGLIKSPELLSEVVDKLNLTKNKNLASGYNGKMGTLKQWVVNELTKNINVNQGQYGSQLIYVTYAAKNSIEAAKIVNAIVDEYKKQDEERAISQPVEQKMYYAKQLRELKKNVEAAQQNFTNFNGKHKLDGEVNNVDMRKLVALDQRLFQAQNQLRQAEASESGNLSASDAVMTSPQIQALKSQLDKQQARLEKMEALYTPQYPDLLRLKVEISSTKKALADAIQSYAENETENISSSRKLVRTLKAAVARQRAKVLANSKIHDEASNYLVALQSAQSLYKRAIDEYQQLQFTPRLQGSNINIVYHATPPLKYSKPKIKKGLVMGVIVSLMLGIGAPLIYELLFNRRIRCSDDLDRVHGIPVLAELGRMSTGMIK